jgi:nitrogen fixation/metabolism regulation signal transduction histidine kinase
MKDGEWVEGLPAEVMVCDDRGTILEMNPQADSLFAQDGGRDLLGSNVLGCHPEPSLTKLKEMLEKQISNAYLNTENGERRFFFQSPWYRLGRYAGFVEISFPVPEEMPHFIRE